MARRKIRDRAGLSRQATMARTTGRRRAGRAKANSSMVSSVVWDFAKMVETGAVRTVRMGQDVLGGPLSRAASMGQGAIGVVGAGARGAVSIGSRVVDSVVGTAQGLYHDALASARPAPGRTRRARATR